jgi:hypothetical protein
MQIPFFLFPVPSCSIWNHGQDLAYAIGPISADPFFPLSVSLKLEVEPRTRFSVYYRSSGPRGELSSSPIRNPTAQKQLRLFLDFYTKNVGEC